MTEIPACPAKDLARLFTPEGKADPYPVYASFRDAGPVLRIGPGHLVVAGFDECSQALHDQRLLSTDATVQDLVQPGWSDHASWRWLSKNMLFSNEPQHDRFRRFFSGSLTARQVVAMRPMVERVVSRIVDGLLFLAGDEPLDLMTHVAYGVPMGVMGELLGIRPEAQMSFRDVIGRITLALAPIVDLAVLEPGDRAMDALAAFFADLVDARRREPRDDLASRWVADRDRTELLSDEELVANLMLLLVAGTEAPMDLVGNTLKLALDHRSEAVDMFPHRGARAGRGSVAGRGAADARRPATGCVPGLRRPSRVRAGRGLHRGEARGAPPSLCRWPGAGAHRLGQDDGGRPPARHGAPRLPPRRAGAVLRCRPRHHGAGAHRRDGRPTEC